jgi:hypothetical protein
MMSIRKVTCTALLILGISMSGAISAWAIGCIGSTYSGGTGNKAVHIFNIDSTNPANDTLWADLSPQLYAYPSGITFAQNGDIYVPEEYASNAYDIQYFQFTGSGWNNCVQTCYLPEQPSSLVVDSNNVLYSSSYFNTDDHIYFDTGTPSMGTASVFATVTASGTASTHGVYDMRMGPSGAYGQNMVWLAKQNYGFVSLVPYGSVAVDVNWTSPTFVRAFDIGETGTDTNSFIYMVNFNAGSIMKCDPTSPTFSPTTVKYDPARLEINSGVTLPQSLVFGPSFKGTGAPSGQKDIYISDYYNSTVNVYRGSDLSWAGSFTNTNGYPTLSIASWISSGVNGYIATAYYQNENIWQVAIYDSTGKCLRICPLPPYHACASGVAFAPNGDLYTLSLNTTENLPEVDKFSYQGGGVWNNASAMVCTVPDGDQQVSLAVDASSNVYVGMYHDDMIYTYPSNGTSGVASYWMTAPGASSFFLDMRFGRTKGSPSSPRLWAAKLNEGLMSFSVGGDQNMVIPFPNARAFDFGPDKALYAVNSTTGRIDRYSPYTGTLLSTGFVNDPANLQASGSVLPNSLTFGPIYDSAISSSSARDIYVGDYYGNNIHLYSGATGTSLGSINNGRPVTGLSAWQPPLLVPTAVPVNPVYSSVTTNNANGDITVNINGDSYLISSMFSTPNSSWVHGTTPNNYFTLTRSLHYPTNNYESILVYDTFTINTSNWKTDLPLMEQHTAASVTNPMRNTWIQGFPEAYGGQYDAGNPTSIGATDYSAICLVPDCDIFQDHATSLVNGGAVTLADNNFVLKYNTTVTVTWGIVLSSQPDYYSVINATRRLWGANFSFGGTLAGYALTPEIFGSVSGQGFANYVTDKSVEWLISSYDWPYYYYLDNNGQPYAMEMYMSSLLPTLNNSYAISCLTSAHTDSPGLKIIGYFHDMLENVTTQYPKFANDKLLTSNGTQVYYQWGDPHFMEFVPYTTQDLSSTNAWGTAISACIPYLLNPVSKGGMGYDGIWWDEMEFSFQRYHYGISASDTTGRQTPPWTGSVPWDGCSADINTNTNQISQYKSSVELITQPFRLKWANTIMGTAYNAALTANGPPHTRSIAALHIPRPTEASTATNCYMAQLYTPFAFGNLQMEQTPQDCYNNMLRYLDFGCLYAWYSELIVPTHPMLTADMFPITPVELHNGYIIGQDRIITKMSGLYEWADNGSAFTLHVYNTSGTLTYSGGANETVSGTGYYAKPITVNGVNYLNLTLASGYSAAILKQGGGYSISGKITLQNYVASVTQVPVTVQMQMSGGGYTSQSINLAADGSYTISGLAPGTYDIGIKASHWLQKVVRGVVVNGNVSGVNVSLINGDCNGDNFVEDQDYSLLGAAWYSSVGDSNYNINADLNGDGYVEDQDYSIMGISWYQQGDTL